MKITSLGITQAHVLELEQVGDFLVVTILGTNCQANAHVCLEIPLLIDDFPGESKRALKALASLPEPVAFAVVDDSRLVLSGYGYEVVLDASELETDQLAS